MVGLPLTEGVAAGLQVIVLIAAADAHQPLAQGAGLELEDVIAHPVVLELPGALDPAGRLAQLLGVGEPRDHVLPGRLGLLAVHPL